MGVGPKGRWYGNYSLVCSLEQLATFLLFSCFFFFVFSSGGGSDSM